MDHRRFDRLTIQMAAVLSRRSLITGLAAMTVLPAAAGSRQVQASRNKRQVCHQTGSSNNPWVVINVSEAAYAAHVGHGDTLYVDCCSDDECAAGQACVGGACTSQCEVPCGTMMCDGTGFVTFVCPGTNGSSCQAVYRDCADGTSCRDVGDGTIVCERQPS